MARKEQDVQAVGLEGHEWHLILKVSEFVSLTLTIYL